MFCNNSNHHDINCESYNNNNALKGASDITTTAVQQQQQSTRQFTFQQEEIKYIDIALKGAGYTVSKLNPQTQEHKNIIDEIYNVLKMLSTKTNNNQSTKLKGASDNNINPFESLDKIINMMGLGNNIVSNNNNNNNQIKGASAKQEIICPKIQSKIQSLIDIRNLFGLT